MNILESSDAIRFVTNFKNKLERYGKFKQASKARGYAEKYALLVAEAIVRNNKDKSWPIDGVFDMPIATELRHKLKHNHKAAYYWSDEHMPLFHVVDKGSNLKKTISRIRLLYDIPIELARENIGWLTNAEHRCDTPINIDSLKCYKHQVLTLANEVGTKFNKYDHHVQQIDRIINLSNEFGGVLPQAVCKHEWGREYLKGVNLQNCPRSVRYAALGDHVEIDLNASVYAWRVMYCMEHLPNESTAHTEYYINNKQQLRNELSKSVFGISINETIDVIKEVLSALSFGARLTSGSKPYRDPFTGEIVVNSVLGAFESARNSVPLEHLQGYIPQKAAEKFRTHSFIGAFYKETQSINKAIKKHWDLTDGKARKSLLSDSGNSISQNRVATMLYHRYEIDMLNAMTSCFHESEVLLRCHDALYVKEFSQLKKEQLSRSVKDINPYATFDVTRRNSCVVG